MRSRRLESDRVKRESRKLGGFGRLRRESKEFLREGKG